MEGHHNVQHQVPSYHQGSLDLLAEQALVAEAASPKTHLAWVEVGEEHHQSCLAAAEAVVGNHLDRPCDFLHRSQEIAVAERACLLDREASWASPQASQYN